MRINHNIQALNAYRNLSQTMSSTSKSLEKLSSGLRINKAADDAAGLAISEKMRSQIRGLDMAERNTLDAISLIQTGEGALSEVHSILQRMRELSVQAANGTLEDQDRQAIQEEVNQLSSEINRIGISTEFNAKKLLNSQISPEARSVEIGEGFTQNLSTIDQASIQLNPKSDLVPSENYQVKIQDRYLNKVSPLDVQNKGVSNINIDSKNSTLTVGTVGIRIKQEPAKVIENNPETSPTIDSIKIAPNSDQPDGNVTLAITRENKVSDSTFKDITSSGIKSATITSANPMLSPDDSFKLNIIGSPSNVAKGTLADSYITDVKVDYASFPYEGNGFQLKFEEKAPVDSGQFQVTLIDNDGITALSAPVVLDDNIQTYEFYKPDGTKLGVSFNAKEGINSGLNAVDPVPAGGMNNTFNIDKKIELVDKNNNQVLDSIIVTDGTPPGVLTLTSNGIDFEIKHAGYNDLDINEFAEFGIESNLFYSTGGPKQSFSLGEQITLDEGIFVKMSNDLSQYGLSENVVITVGTNNSYTAELVNGVGTPIDDAPKIVVQNDKSYSFGDPANITFNTDILQNGTTQFLVGKDAKTDAILEVNGEEIERLENIQANSSLSFHNEELTMNIGDLTNGDATFAIAGGNIDNSIQMQIGANAGQTLDLGIRDMRSQALGLTSENSDSIKLKDKDGNEVEVHFTETSSVSNGSKKEYGISLLTTEQATAAIVAFDQAITKVSFERSNLGAIQNRLEHTTNNLQTASENLTSAESRIRDLDMAEEMATFTKNNILNQAGQAMLSQANQLPQGILQLLKG